MSKRIRYDFTDREGKETSIGVSRQAYGTTVGSVKIVIDKENFVFEIVNSDGKPVAAGGGTKNYIVLLRKAKRALEHLGYTFNSEERDRDFGVRPVTND